MVGWGGVGRTGLGAVMGACWGGVWDGLGWDVVNWASGVGATVSCAMVPGSGVE